MTISATKPLTRPYLSILVTFHEAGGAADLDNHCRIVVGPGRHPMPGDTLVWMLLMAHGMVAGEGGRVIITELGRATAEGIIAGRVRESV